MDTLESVSIARHVRFTVETASPEVFIDLTDRITTLVAVSGLRNGLVNIQSLHTTTAIVVNEHEPLLLEDFASVLSRAAPLDGVYAHDDPSRRTVNLTGPGDERPNGHAHCRALLLPTSACLNVVRGEVQLGRWQRVFLVELDGPQERGVSVMMTGEGWR